MRLLSSCICLLVSSNAVRLNRRTRFVFTHDLSFSKSTVSYVGVTENRRGSILSSPVSVTVEGCGLFNTNEISDNRAEPVLVAVEGHRHVLWVCKVK